MKENGWETALLTSPSAVYYFTGFRTDPMERFIALWVAEGSEAVLFAPLLDEGKAESAVGIGRKVLLADEDSPLDALRKHCGNPPKVCGVDKMAMHWQFAEQIHKLWPDTAFLDIGPHIRRTMGRKSREEADSVRQAARIADQALEAALAGFRIGMREFELAEEIARQIRLAGGDGPAFGPTVVSGLRTALPHANTGDKPICEGDLLVIDMGVSCSHYLSDMTRTFAVGAATAKQAHLYETVQEASRRAIAAVRPGALLADIDLAAREYIASQGYGRYFIHRVGHGLGLDIHEEPSIHRRNIDPIAAGMVFTVEPGIYVQGVGGVRIEDDVYVNEQGETELLTAFPRALRCL